MKKIIGILSHVYIIGFALLLLYIIRLPNLFSYHPFLMVVGYILLMSEGVLIARYIRGNRKYWMKWHLYLQLSGYICVLVAFGVIYQNKINSEKMHFTSWHSIFGIISLIISTVQVGVGLVLYFLPKFVKDNFGIVARVKIIRFHRSTSDKTHCLSLLLLCSGFFTNYSMWKFGTYLSYTFILLVIIVMVIVLFAKPKFQIRSRSTNKNNNNTVNSTKQVAPSPPLSPNTNQYPIDQV